MDMKNKRTAKLSTATRKRLLEEHISKIAGAPVSMTIRGLKEFTWSTEDRNDEAAEKIRAYFAAAAKSVTVAHDDECGSFVYVNAI
jgi:GTP cyclohydrolase II